MRTLIVASLALALTAGAASAQFYSTQPNIYGQPQYGSTTTGPSYAEPPQAFLRGTEEELPEVAAKMARSN
jgi:hypothetical protein